MNVDRKMQKLITVKIKFSKQALAQYLNLEPLI